MSVGQPCRILIADDAPSVREALRWALEDEHDLQIVGEAGDGWEAFMGVLKLSPDVAVLDITMPGLDGFDVARMLKGLPYPPLVIFLTVHDDPQTRQRGHDAGVDGFVEKSAGGPALIAAVRRAFFKQ